MSAISKRVSLGPVPLRRVLLPLVMLLPVVTHQAVSTTATLQASKDTYIKGMSGETGKNFGVSTSLMIDRENTDPQRVLVQFDLSSIPAGAIVSSATLKLQATDIGGTLNISVYELQESWSEGTQNGSAGEANWDQRMTGTNWTTAGGTYDATAVDNLHTGSTGEHAWNVTSLVQAWVDGSKTNYGFMVGTPHGGGNRTATYDSREGTTPPMLEVVYTVSYSISGKVFEDLNYGGGAGRNGTTSSANGGSACQNARVELFNGSADFSASTTTDASGNYTFSGLTPGTYYLRVVTSSITSSRSGYTGSCVPVLTFRTDASSGTATDVTNYVGGLDPATPDAGDASSGWTLDTLTGVFGGSGSGKAHAFAPVVISSADVPNVDWGWCFNVVANTNNSGQGSLRQFITNGNTLGGDASLAQSGLIVAKENAVFMISNGTASAGLRATNNYFSGGIATISPTSALPTVSTVMVLDAQKQPGWTSAPVLQLNCTSAASTGLTITGGSSTVKGFILNNLNNWHGINITTNGGNTIAGNYIGIDYTGETTVGATYTGINIDATAGNIIGGTVATDRNVIGGYSFDAVSISGASATGNIVRGNYLGLSASGSAGIAGDNGVSIKSGASGNTIGGTSSNDGNIISGNTVSGITLSSGGNTVQGNGLGLNGTGSGYVINYEGIVITSDNNTIGGTAAGSENIIARNSQRGVKITTGTGNAVLRNSIYENTYLGIDIGSVGVLANNGTKNSGLPNYDMDHPVFTSAILNGTTLTVAGYVGSAPNQSTFADARVEIFKSDNDASGYGEGQTYLGYLTADGNGNISGAITVSGLAGGDKVTGTATDGSNNTSEFGANFTVSGVYYSKGSLAANVPGNWNTAPDGSGTDAAAFSANNIWIVQNGHLMTLGGASSWDVTASGTVQIQNGGTWTNSSSGAVTIGTFQIDNGGAYIHSSGTMLPGTAKTFGATSTVNYAGSTQTVAAAAYGNLVVSAAGTKTLAGNVSIASDLTVSAGTLDLGSFTANRSTAGGTLSVSNDATLKIGGTNGFPSNYSTRTLGATSTVEYAGADQPVSAETYGHLTLSAGGTKTPAARLTVMGNFTIGGGVTFNASSFTHAVQGNITNDGTFTAGTSLVQLTGSADASITGPTTFNDLTISKTSGTNLVTLNSPVAVSTLNMTQGKLVAGSNGVTITSTRTGSGIITGMITRTHLFNSGIAYEFESPYNTLTFAAGGTLPTSVTVNVVLLSPPANGSMVPIDRYYDISQAGGSGFTYDLRLHYEDSEVSPPNSETSPPLKIWRRTSTGPDVWERKGATANSTVNNWVEVSGMTETGVWSLSSTTVGVMALTLAQDKTYPSPGEQVTYTITYINSGDGTATNTLVTASAPVNTSYATGSVVLNGVGKTDAADADEVTVTGATIGINLGAVSSGSSGTITYRVVIN